MSSGFVWKSVQQIFWWCGFIKIPLLKNPPEASPPTLVPTRSGNALIGLCWLCQLGKRHININMRRTAASHNLDRRLYLHVDMSCARFNQEDKQSKKKKRERNLTIVYMSLVRFKSFPSECHHQQWRDSGLDPLGTCDRKNFSSPTNVSWKMAISLQLAGGKCLRKSSISCQCSSDNTLRHATFRFPSFAFRFMPECSKVTYWHYFKTLFFTLRLTQWLNGLNYLPTCDKTLYCQIPFFPLGY